jgi:hypothetical protein
MCGGALLAAACVYVAASMSGEHRGRLKREEEKRIQTVTLSIDVDDRLGSVIDIDVDSDVAAEMI